MKTKSPQDKKKELEWHLSRFPYSISSYSCGYSSFTSLGIEFRIAYILWLAGATEVNLSFGYSHGCRNQIEQIRIHENSITVKPYIKCPVSKDDNILWWLIKKAGIGVTGCAGDNYMQVGFLDKKINLTKVVVYFNIIKEEFSKP